MNAKQYNIGFIGLGLMGKGFTERLVKMGYSVIGYDLDFKNVKEASVYGVRAGNSPEDVASQSDIVMLCVTSTDAVEEVIFGPKGISQSTNSGSLLIDFSTTIVASTKKMAKRLKDETNMGWIDAPVSGGPDACRDGSLAIMAGGSKDDIESVRPLLEQLSTTFTVFGDVGAGQVAKMVNQVLVLNNYVILAEALALAEAGGIDTSKIPEALAAGHAGSNLLRDIFPRMIARDFEPKGYARQILKDLDMIHDLAKEFKIPTPMSAQAAALFRILNSKGYDNLDGIAILKLLDQNDKV
ncbi:MAG: NAD(P)-dependent oxidoreductase [Alphaproteobacteria bacterium]|nr:MAG: NAD(P)-dependent oxidoreductase [Alphaproteobacteria bacterium]